MLTYELTSDGNVFQVFEFPENIQGAEVYEFEYLEDALGFIEYMEAKYKGVN